MIRLIIVAVFIFPFSALADPNPSILQITVPGGKFQLVNKNSFPKPQRDDSNLIKWQRRSCQQGSSNKCLSFADSMIGTAFVFIQENMILTSLHTFEDYLTEYWKIEDKNTDIPIPLVLIKDGGAVMFGDRTSDQAYLTKISDTARQRLLDGSQKANEEEDFVLIKLSRNMGPPLRAAKADVNVGQTVLVDGFVRHRFVNEWTSSGAIVSKTRFGISKAYWWDCGFSDTSWKLLQFANYDSDGGLSGAPVLNAAGEVVGIQTGYCNSNEMNFFIPISVFLKTQ
jgi:V8-like Glu-specific endopeptidase